MQESAYLSSQHVQHSRGEDKDAIAKCESGFGAALRGGVWGAEWVAYGAKYALVHSYGLVDKTVASGGCRHDTSPGNIWLTGNNCASFGLSQAILHGSTVLR